MCCTVLKFSLQSAATTGNQKSQEGRGLGTPRGGGTEGLGPILGKDLHPLPREPCFSAERKLVPVPWVTDGETGPAWVADLPKARSESLTLPTRPRPSLFWGKDYTFIEIMIQEISQIKQ